MYTTRTHNINQNTSRLDLENYIKTNPISDIYNSELLNKIDNYPEYKAFKITKSEYRIDKIAEEIYADSGYSWILLYLNRCSINELVIGKILFYIDKPALDNIINSL